MATRRFPAKVKRKLRKHAFVVNIEMFKLDVGVFFSTKDFIDYVRNAFGIKVYKRDFVKSSNAEAGAVFDKKGCPYFYMLFHNDNPLIGIVAHECVHVSMAICEKIGVPTTRDTDETLAYMVGYLVQSVVDEIIAENERPKDEKDKSARKRGLENPSI